MNQLQSLLDFTWPQWANTPMLGTNVKSLLAAGLSFTLTLVVLRGLLRLARRYLPQALERSFLGPSMLIHGKIVESIAAIRSWTLVAIALYVALQNFTFPARTEYIINFACFLAITIQILMVANIWIEFVFRDSPLVKGTHSQIRTISSSLTSVVMIICWTLAFLVLFDNFGFDVKTIIAGLGVGGLAIGLALQSVLGDIIASFSIGLDAPFEVGDFVIVGDLMGTVDRVGLKTTRIRALSGELLVFPNSKLVGSSIKNFKRMEQRRVLFQLNLTYDTMQAQIEEIPGILKEAVTSTKQTRFDRAHFFSYGESSLVFEIVYYVLGPDYNLYMDIQQEINFKIRREFDARGIKFAFPTRSLELPAELQQGLLKALEKEPASNEGKDNNEARSRRTSAWNGRSTQASS